MFNPDLQIGGPFTIRAVAVGTGSYVAGTVMSMAAHNAIGLGIVFTKGDETSLQVKIEVSNDGGTTYFQQVTESTSGGTITDTLAERSFTATGNYSILVTPVRGLLVKVSVKMTGGTPTGTVRIDGWPLWV